MIQRLTRLRVLPLIGVLSVAMAGCSSGNGGSGSAGFEAEQSAVTPRACDSEPEILVTAGGQEFVRTPDSCFDNLPGFSYEAKYVEIDGLRQAYIEEGPEDGAVVLLLHGQPSWSYLYRKMIPVLSGAGYRVIAMDHLGLGRSDKPVDIAAYTYLGHNERLERFIESLGLRDINLFVQDWGSLIGLRVAGLNPDWFASIAVGDGALPVLPEGFQPFPPVDNPDEVVDIPFPFEAFGDQQEPYYDGCELLLEPRGEEGGASFGYWMEYAMKAESFHASEVVEALTWFPLSDEEEAAYDAPFPSRPYMAGIRKFPSIVNELGGQNDEAMAGLLAYEKPFITIWASNDPGNLGSCEAQNFFINNVPGAAGQAHARLPEASHFLQDDQGEEIARRLVEFYENPAPFVPTEEAEPVAERVGFEILEVIAPNEIIVWVSAEITLEEFNALELPEGWRKNQPREPDSTAGSFARSPDAAEDGPLLEEEMFGFSWRHNATVVETGIVIDEQGLLNGALVAKYHTITYDAGSVLQVLVSPEGEQYLRVSRDVNRVSEDPTLPAGWRIVEREIDGPLTLDLPNPTLNIRADNQDSFQGPVDVLPGDDLGPGSGADSAAPLVLSDELCENPDNMDVLLNSSAFSRLSGSASRINAEQVQRMIEAPAAGPFYMFNLILYREQALYADGRETDLTGREANALYSPVEFLDAIGARVVFSAAVDRQIDGDSTVWEDVAIVEYPCPIAFFAMTSDPAFQARAVHKDAGVEKTIVMVTHLEPSLLPPGHEAPESPYPATEEDPSFQLIHVMDFRDTAQYEDGVDEPERTGAEAWAEYESNGSGAGAEIGALPTARFRVQGVFLGDSRDWDQIHFNYMPSLAGFQALLDNETRQAGRYHRIAALENNYSLITYPRLNVIPDAPGVDDDSGPLPITDLGVGTPCTSDDDCAGIGFCLSDGGGFGICTRACGAGECGEPYVCCHSCSGSVAQQLPFKDSACLPASVSVQLTAAPASCSCE